MKWTRGYSSSNVEDRRGGPRRTTMVAGGGGLVGVIIALLYATGVIGGGTGGAPSMSGGQARQAPTAGVDRDAELKSFVSFVLDDAQRTWAGVFERAGKRYRDAKLVLFTDSIDSACGFAQAATGPFYCPADQKIYIDLGFFRALSQNLGAPGDFAQAYVIAHEIGHHVQTLLGTSQAVAGRSQSRPAEANALSVRLELQADCFAGVWGHGTAERKLLEVGDIEEGLNAAAAIGDDRLTGGRLSPERFTHGSSAQRVRWFKRGLEQGTIEACDTFSASSP